MATPIRDALLDAWAVLMPVDCAGCNARDRSVCESCRAVLTAAPTWRRLPDGTPVVSALDYGGAVRQAIISFKEKGRTDAARALARPLAVAVGAAVEAASTPDTRQVELVTIPSSRSSYSRRGYDPVVLLLRLAGIRRPARVLVHSRRTARQKALGRDLRSRNLVWSLSAKHPLFGRRFVIVDDVVTTGATLAEACRAIEAAGGIVVSAVTLAYTARRFPARSRH